MTIKSLIPIRFFCGIISLYHIVEGIAACISGEFAATMAWYGYGVQITTVTPFLEVVFRFIGAFALSFGVMMAFAAINPTKNKTVIYGGIVFFGVRAIERLLFSSLIRESLSIPEARYNFGTLAVVVMFLGLMIFMPRGDIDLRK